jgi:hypothetical protein
MVLLKAIYNFIQNPKSKISPASTKTYTTEPLHKISRFPTPLYQSNPLYDRVVKIRIFLTRTQYKPTL